MISTVYPHSTLGNRNASNFNASEPTLALGAFTPLDVDCPLAAQSAFSPQGTLGGNRTCAVVVTPTAPLLMIETIRGAKRTSPARARPLALLPYATPSSSPLRSSSLGSSGSRSLSGSSRPPSINTAPRRVGEDRSVSVRYTFRSRVDLLGLSAQKIKRHG
jgi:hypothetical protein